MPHGDASPQNLLVPAADPSTFVLIDISFQNPAAVGFDLGQLLVGLVHADLMSPDRLTEIADAVVPAFVSGLRAEGDRTSAAQVEEAFALSLLLRSGFDSMRYDLVDDHTSAGRTTFAHRLGLTQFAVDRAEAVLV